TSGEFQANLTGIDVGASNILEIIRDANNNGGVDSGEIVASGLVGQTVTYNVVTGGAYYLRVSAQLNGEFYTSGNYRLAWASAGTLSGSTITNPGNITVGPKETGLSGYLAFD